jgi:predicted enzyme related to lactoylglutathione lyase
MNAMGQPVVHFEINGKDGAKLRSFYGDLFDWKITVDPTYNYGLVDTGVEGSLGGGIGESPDASGTTVYIQVADLQATLDQAEALGGKVVMPITDIPGVVTIAQFADPEGNVVGLIKG